MRTSRTTIRDQRWAFRDATHAREAAKVQVIVAMALDGLARERIFYHQTQLELLSGRKPKYVTDTQDPFEVWIVMPKHPRSILNWTTVHTYSGIFYTQEFNAKWKSALDAAIVALNELPEIQSLGEVYKTDMGNFALREKAT